MREIRINSQPWGNVFKLQKESSILGGILVQKKNRKNYRHRHLKKTTTPKHRNLCNKYTPIDQRKMKLNGKVFTRKSTPGVMSL